jgi:hypothetical protein
MTAASTPGRELLDFDTLLSKWQNGHDRSCVSRQYHCNCGFNLAAEGLLGILEDRDAKFENVLKTASPELLKSLARAWRIVAYERRDKPEAMNRPAAKPADEGVRCLLLNQIEVMGAVSLLLRYAKPDLVGKAGELDLQRDDLLQRHKATQAALSTTGEPKQ